MYGFVGLLLLVVWLFALFEAITADAGDVRNLAKGFWIVIILLTFEIGAVLWFIAGRPQVRSRPGGLPYKGNAGPPRPAPGGAARGPVGGRGRAPDDDPDFLKSLDRDHMRRWEADLRRREQDVRKRDGREDGAPGPDAPGSTGS